MTRKTICCLLLTMVLVCAAILLPGAILDYQQHTLTERVFTKPAVQLSIDSEINPVIQTLQIMNIDTVPLAELDEDIFYEEMQKKLNEQLCILHDLGITIPFIHNPKEQEVQVQDVTKVLYFGDDSIVSVYRMNIDQGIIWMDSKTDKIVQASFFADKIDSTDDIFDDLITRREETAYNPAQELYAWAEYYGLDAYPSILEPAEQDGSEYYWANEVLFLGFLQDQNGQQVGFTFSCSYQYPLEDSPVFFDIGSISTEAIDQIQQQLQD